MTTNYSFTDNRLLLKQKAEQLAEAATRTSGAALVDLAESALFLAKSIVPRRQYRPPPAEYPDFPEFQGG